MRHVVILGGGTGGTMMVNLLAKHRMPDAWKLTVIDRDDVDVYQPGLLFIRLERTTAKRHLSRVARSLTRP